MSTPVRTYDEFFIETTDPSRHGADLPAPPSGVKLEAPDIVSVLSESNPVLSGDTIIAAFQTGGLQIGLSIDDAGGVVGSPLYPIQQRYWDWQQRANNTDGTATGILAAPKYSSRAFCKEGDAGEQYAPGKDPFVIQARREYWPDPTGNGSGAWAGWYCSGYLVNSDRGSGITSRSIYWEQPQPHTTGAFIWDEDQEVYRTPLWIGSGIVDEYELIDYALMLGSAQEGGHSIPENEYTSEAWHWQETL